MALDPDRWARIQDIFHRLVDVPSAERAARLDAACGDDAALRAEILDLFEADVDADSVLDRDVEAVSESLRGAAPGEGAAGGGAGGGGARPCEANRRRGT